MYSLAVSAVALLSTFLPTALAQTHTDCDPLKEDGCPNMVALGGNATFRFNDSMSDKIWEQKTQGDVDWSQKGTTFTIKRSGDSPMIQSTFYMLFGRFEVVMKASKGQGIVSSAILQSECLDEIDWEFLGQKDEALTNFFGKGNTTNFDRGENFNMSSPHDDFHNYTIDWTKDRVQWWIDGEMKRELKYDDPLTIGGKNYPQTPMNIRLGSWAGGDKTNNDPGVVEWAGETNFDKAPFLMTVQEVYAKDYTSAKEYSWEDMDKSGSWEKVKVIEGKSEALKEIESPSGVKGRWEALSKGAKIAIIASCVGAFVVGICVLVFCCIKQRRAGRREYAAFKEGENKEQAELLEYRSQMQSGKFGYGRV